MCGSSGGRFAVSSAGRAVSAVLRVAQLVTTLARGGAQATVLGSSRLRAEGIDVTVLAGTDDPGEGTHWADVRSEGIKVVAVPCLRRSVDPSTDLRALWWLVRWLRANRPDVVHTHSAKAGMLGRIAARIVGIPAIHTVHGWTAASVQGGRFAEPRRRALVEVERRLARLCQALVVVTPFDAAEGLTCGIGSPAQYRIIRSGIDLADPREGHRRRNRIRSRLGLEDRFVVGAVGRLSDQKDLRTLVSGFARANLAEGELVVVGDGPRRLDLERQVQQLGLSDRVRFLGQRPDAAKLIGAFDVLVSTSLWEGLPRTIIEAMAAEVPVVATPVGGVAEVVHHGETGTLIPVSDPGAVAAALIDHASDPGGSRTSVERANEQVAAFAVERMRRDLAALWFEVAGRSEHSIVPSADRAVLARIRSGAR